MRDWLRLVRAPLAPTAAWDVVAATAMALTAAGRPLSALTASAWLLLALSGLLVYAAGMIWNDVADRKRDLHLAPDRPIPAGRIGTGAAFAAGVLLATAAILLGGGPAGSREAVTAAVLLAALYDGLLKRWVVPGALAMGGARFTNASTGVLPFVLSGAAPSWILLGPAAIGLYSAAITLWSTTEDDEEAPSPTVRTRRLASRLLGAAAFGTAGVLSWVVPGHLTLGTVIAFGPFTSLLFARRPKPGPPKRQVLEMLLALYLLSMCLATTGDGGSLLVNGVAFVTAFLLIYVTQIGIRALRPPS